MTSQEANKIIAEFMGEKFPTISCKVCGICEDHEVIEYTESLDALVPVWEKLNPKKCSPKIVSLGGLSGHWVCVVRYAYKLGSLDWDGEIVEAASTAQEAAAIATAKAILDLTKSK